MTQIQKNFMTNMLSLCANLIVGIFYTPYLVKNIGIVAYGFIPLSLLLNQYINILANSLTRAITRFFSIEYKRNNFKKASVYLSSSIIFAIILAFVLIPLCSIPIYYIDKIFQIPTELVESAKVLFYLSVISFFVSVITNCINITIFADNRLDLINYVKILRSITKLLFNIVLFVAFDQNLLWVGTSYLLSEISATFLSIFVYKKTKSIEISFSLMNFELNVIKPIFSMIAWVALISFADTFLYKIDAVLVTNYFGLENTGMLGSMSEFGSYCISIASVFGSLFGPLILIAYSENRHEDVQRLTLNGGYVIGLLTCLMCGLVIGSSKDLLSIWLTPEIAEHNIWMIIKIAIIPFTTIGGIYATVYNYWNKVKWPAIISLIIAIGYVLISIIVLNNGIGMVGFLLFNLFAVLLQGYVMNTYMLNKIYPKLSHRLGKVLVKQTIFLLIISVITYFICSIIAIDNMLVLLLALCLSGIVGCIVMSFFLSSEELDILDLVIPVKKVLSSIIKR